MASLEHESLPASAIERGQAALLARVVGGGLVPANEVAPAGAPPIGDDYRIEQLLGEGGVGQVWAATYLPLRKSVAIKVLKADAAKDPNTRRRFLREARTAATIRHENVVEVTEVGETEDGHPYMVMERLEGQTLGQLIDDAAPLPWPIVSSILTQLCDALEVAHELHIVHRDLKPGNVFLIERRGEPHYCKIIDFGLAKLRVLDEDTKELTHAGQVFGTPSHMAPEQIRGEDVDGRADLYALGVMAYTMLTGRKPFEGATISELFYQHLFTAPPGLGNLTVDGASPRALEALILRALRKDRENRFSVAREMAQAIADADDGVVVAVPDERLPTDPHHRAVTPPHRSTRWLVGGLALALAGLGFAFTRDAPAPAPETLDESTRPSAASAAPAAPVAPVEVPPATDLEPASEVSIVIELQPPQARLIGADGEVLGHAGAPIELSIPHGDRPILYQAVAEGHVSQRIPVTPDRDQAIQRVLVRSSKKSKRRGVKRGDEPKTPPPDEPSPHVPSELPNPFAR